MEFMSPVKKEFKNLPFYLRLQWTAIFHHKIYHRKYNENVDLKGY